MSRSQSEIDSLLQQFIGQYAGQRPGYYGFTGECLSLAKLWLDVVRNGNINGALGAPASPDGWGSGYWSQVPPQVDELFSRQGYNPNAEYPAGSLFVNTATHHIGILISNNPGQPSATVFHQNANPDGSAAHTGQRLKSQIDGVLVLRVDVSTLPEPVPQPPFHIVADYAPHRQLQVTTNTKRYNLNLRTTPEMADSPIGPAYPGDRIEAVSLAEHVNGEYYYIAGDSADTGWNVKDCTDYVVPPQPYVPPAPAVKVPLVPYYEVVTTLMYFKTAIDAKRHENALGTINKGQYVEIKTEDNVKCLVRKNTDTDSLWINTSDNVVESPFIPLTPTPVIDVSIPPTLPVDPPKVVSEPIDIAPQIIVPTPVQPKQPIQWGWINDNHQPSLFQYQGVNDIQVKDLEGSYPAITMTPGTKKVISRYTMIGNQSFLLPDKEFNAGKAYGIDESKQMVEIKKPTLLTEVTGDFGNFFDYLETGFKSTARLITDISPVKISHAATRIKQTMDGINSKRKVK